MILPRITERTFEQGPIRPPSEAYSLLIRATRNCPWNRCQFCPVYRGQRFELRPTEDVIKDIDTAKAITEDIKQLAWKTGNGGQIKEVAATIYNQSQYNCSISNVALWLWAGANYAFLQDANSLIMRTPDLLQVIVKLKESFPGLTRITSYARSKTASKKTIDELKQLKDAGLSRLHIGLESGSDQVLSYMDKGVTADEQIRGGKNVKTAGISLSEYIMPGLGGRNMTVQHSRETARVLNEINPDFIRVRPLYVRQEMDLWSRIENGDFELQNEDEVIEEVGRTIEDLKVTSELKSDHILNLLPELDGKFPDVKQICLDTIRRYLALPEKERLNFRLGRRAGLYEKLDDIYDAAKFQKVDQIINRIASETSGNVDDAIRQLMESFV